MAFFAAGKTVYTTQLPGGVHETLAIDLNHDGLLDLVSARLHWPPKNVGIALEVLFGNGHGSFAKAASALFTNPLPTTVHPREIVTADFNRDGRLDIFIADHGYDADPFPGVQNRLLLSSGQKYVNASATHLPQVRDFTHSATAGDIDRDGDQDLYVGNLFGQLRVGPYFLINNGLGVFTRSDDRLPAAIADLDQNRWVTSALGDFNRDGRVDLFLGSDVGNTSAVLLNDGTGHFAGAGVTLPAEPFGVGSIAVDSHVRDINKDGHNDVVVVFTRSNYTDRSVKFWINQGDGTFRDETSQRLNFVAGKGDWLAYVHFADFNRDGAPDLITEQRGSGPAQVLINDGDGFYFRPLNSSTTFTGGAFEVGDFNRDGRPDVLAWGGKDLDFYAFDDGPIYPLTGNAAANTLVGDARANTMSGLGGNDVVCGGAGKDTIDGGAGNDRILGGSGADRLAGGANRDTFVFNTALNGATNRDTIVDFTAPADTIQLENAIFTKLVGGNTALSAAQFFKGAAAHDADDRIVYNGATGALIYDSNGNAAGGAVVFATVAKNLPISHLDFFII
jgi:Ca2+-binding RTX toxin-like protein